MYICKWCNFRISKGKVNEIIGKDPKDLERQANELLKKSKH